jgi:radical SAM enzyme (TIGR01210 family)
VEKSKKINAALRASQVKAISALLPSLIVILGQARTRQMLASLIGEEFCYTRNFAPKGHRPMSEGFIELPTGCSWAKRTGGCTFCSFQRAVDNYTGGGPVLDSEYIDLFKAGHRLIHGSREINIFNGGSFWDGLPKQVQDVITARLAMDPAVKQLNIESRPEYITPENISNTRAGLNLKRLRVGIGLETQDDNLRNKMLNKGMTRQGFEGAVKLLKEMECLVAVYVLMKPHKSLREADAIAETVATIKYVHGLGADVVLLQAMMIMPDSLSYGWYHDGDFRPPWLWSVIEVIRQTHKLLPIRLGKFEDSPKPLAIPTNCWKCNNAINTRLDHFRENLDFSLLENIPDCDCRIKWQKETS